MKIALTFDVERDIPSVLDTFFGITDGIPKILDVLDAHDIKGTFFCTGTVVESHPDQLKSLEENGHEIACHGLSHERLSKLDFDACRAAIFRAKTLVEKTCSQSEIIGFRAPYLDPPSFLFKILDELGFKYDSSISSPKKLANYQGYDYKVWEFHPTILNGYFRFRITYPFLRKKIFSQRSLGILYFHPWEAIDTKKLMKAQLGWKKMVKNQIFRPDRTNYTGKSFLIRLNNFIEEALSKNSRFVTLKNLISS